MERRHHDYEKANPENNICIKFFYILKSGENYKSINKANCVWKKTPEIYVLEMTIFPLTLKYNAILNC